MEKNKRHAALLKIIAEQEVETQQELQILLREQGFKVTQATISRDMRELKINKGLSENGVNCYYAGGVSGSAEYNAMFAQSVTSLDYAMNTVVIKCRAGLANAACSVVDEQEFGFVVGTIAGDDTVFVLTRSESHAIQLIEHLKRLMTR